MYRRSIILSVLLICLLLLIIPHFTADGETVFEVKRIGNINPYADNSFQVISDESGLISIIIHDNTCTYRILSQRIESGETVIHWDGCGYNREKLYNKYYTVTASVKTDSGAEHTVSFNTPVDYPVQFLSYALPSSDQLFLDATEDWFLEYRTVQDGTINIEMTAENESVPSFTYSIHTAGGKILKKDFASICRGNNPQPGSYSVVVYEVSIPEEKQFFTLTISEQRPDPQPVFITGEIMPDRSMSDDEIWDLMMRPSVVIDIDFFKHQQIYAKPDFSSASLGTIHGQTQALNVIRIEHDWAMIGAWNHEEAAYVEGWVPLSVLKVENPGKDYGLLIDKQKQTLSVYFRGQVIDTLLVSTGRAEKNKLYQETSAGCFLTGYHRVNFSTNGKKYDYVIQYDGGNLLHQIPYEWGEHKKEFISGRGFLGAKASHACIRIQAEPGEGGLNAYWLFTHLPYHTRVIILDDPYEREAVTGMLKRAESEEPDFSIIQTVEHLEPADDETVILTFGGCLIPGGNQIYNEQKDSFASFTEKQGYDMPLMNLRNIFEKDHLTCICLSCPIAGSSESFQNKTICCARYGMEKILENASVELVQMTDDSLFAAGPDLYTETVSSVQKYSDTLEHGKTLAKVLNGHLFGFAGCSESEYLADPSVIDRLIQDLRNRKCEKIVFLVCCDKNQAAGHSITQEAIANRCVNAGADLIVENKQGTVQGIDYIRGIPVVYSLGTLLDGSTSAIPKQGQGLLVRVTYSFSSCPDTVSITAIPILPYGKNTLHHNDFLPTDLLTSEESGRVIKTIWQDTSDPAMKQLSFYIH